jgi:hypothetical protein
MSDTPAKETNQEYITAFFDYLKHMTTLSTGSIVLIAAFLEKVFTKPLWKGFVVTSLIGFMLSVLSSVVVYTNLLLFEFPRPNRKSGMPNWAGNLAGIGAIATWAGFLIGILSLAVFAIRNFIS